MEPKVNSGPWWMWCSKIHKKLIVELIDTGPPLWKAVTWAAPEVYLNISQDIRNQ